MPVRGSPPRAKVGQSAAVRHRRRLVAVITTFTGISTAAKRRSGGAKMVKGSLAVRRHF